MKGILFKPDMIKAIREGRKTVTRRLDGLKEINIEPDRWYYLAGSSFPELGRFTFYNEGSHMESSSSVIIKPRYKISEVMYIKEVWATDKMFDAMSAKQIEETKVSIIPLWYKFADNQRDNPNTIQGKWRSPLFMPSWAARYFRQIMGVRLERLQEITPEDIKAEGVITYYDCDDACYHILFQQLWDFINPRYPWASNPWNFRYEFKLVKEEEK